MMARLGFVFAVLLPFFAASAHAQTLGLTDRDKEVIEIFFEQHPSLQDKSHAVRFLDPLAQYPPCDRRIEVTPPMGRQKLWGSVNLTVECLGATTFWKRTVPVRVEVFGSYAVTAKPLPPNRALSPEDYVWMEGEITGQAGQLANHETELQGVETVRPLSHGAPIRLNDLRPIAVIKRGEAVKLTIIGSGFAVETSAFALGNAKMGDTLQIRTKEGKVITAVAVGKAEAETRLD
jgi:flagellar basal body P-ring formation protein FlgA